jgi:hypothetical protein
MVCFPQVRNLSFESSWLRWFWNGTKVNKVKCKTKTSSLSEGVTMKVESSVQSSIGRASFNNRPLRFVHLSCGSTTPTLNTDRQRELANLRWPSGIAFCFERSTDLEMHPPPHPPSTPEGESHAKFDIVHEGVHSSLRLCAIAERRPHAFLV